PSFFFSLQMNLLFAAVLLFCCRYNSFLEVGQHIWERCDTARARMRRGCPFDRLEDPRGAAVLLKGRKITFHPKEQRHQRRHRQPTQLQPQTVLLHLRPGGCHTNSAVKEICLSQLQTLFLHRNNLPSVKKLGADLIEEMKNITSDFRMGFGAFVDEAVMPYISTAEDTLRNPCKKTEPCPCAPRFTYPHVLSLAADGSLFTELVGGGGGLEAVMQAAVCEVILLFLSHSTDAGFHFAGDGKLGDIVLPNDGKCHLVMHCIFYLPCQDYPSVTHVAETLRQKNIQIIFAVTENVRHLYEVHRSIFPKCAVRMLSNNSHNILQIIVDAYNALTSEVVMENSKLPPGYHISYTSHCKDHRLRHGEQGRRCSDISIGDEVCSGWLCVCCGNGALECGTCRCKGGRVGTFGECDQAQSHRVVDSYLCMDNTYRQPLSNNTCHIFQEVIISHFFYHVLLHQVCGVCMCLPAFSGGACECPLSLESCLSQDGQICADRGDCHCGTCICHDDRFQGPTCELCPSCPSVCTLAFILCRAFSLGLNPEECEMRCSTLNLTLVGQAGVLATVAPSSGLHKCMEVDTEGCRVHFLLSMASSVSQDCPSGPNVILITAVLSASVVVLGVALLLLWKLLTSIYDRREFARFQKELEQRHWSRVSPPIYKSAITTVVNPKSKEQ
uniref:Integrin beta n=1 Tax=Seriola dumerili TaxID=41447 RepID=A0A3B4UAQ9_SERDU